MIALQRADAFLCRSYGSHCSLLWPRSSSPSSCGFLRPLHRHGQTVAEALLIQVSRDKQHCTFLCPWVRRRSCILHGPRCPPPCGLGRNNVGSSLNTLALQSSAGFRRKELAFTSGLGIWPGPAAGCRQIVSFSFCQDAFFWKRPGNRIILSRMDRSAPTWSCGPPGCDQCLSL